MSKKNAGLIVPDEIIMNKIFLIRGQKVMIDRHLAELYGTTTVRLNEQVKCNKKRFPSDFMFQLTEREKDEVIANCDHLKIFFNHQVYNCGLKSAVINII